MDRSWMYARTEKNGNIKPEFITRLEEFILYAGSQPRFMDGVKIRCPCKDPCKNKRFHEPNEVRLHLYRRGFIPDYYEWTSHGEPFMRMHSQHRNMTSTSHQGAGTSEPYEPDGSFEPDESDMHNSRSNENNPYRTMVMDAAGTSFDPNNIGENPAPYTKNLYNMIQAADTPLWDGCQKMTELSATTRLLSMKSEFHFPERLYNNFCGFVNDCLPEDNKMPSNFYSTKKLMKGMGLPVEKIHCCINGCMLYWRGDSHLRACKVCHKPRYQDALEGSKKKEVAVKKMYYFPIAPRLQRLYASKATAKHMRWHAEHDQEEGVMRHTSDSYAWKYFNHIHESFAEETRNVRLGLSADGFQTFGNSGETYSSWPVILTPYNLPPDMCLKEQFMFLTVIVPGPKSPCQMIDVYLQPLIAELQMLWNVGVDTYDISLKQNFMMRVALMWTVSDFPAYAMLSGWSTHGKFACPHCMEHSEAFQLKHGGKPCWFDCHRSFLQPGHAFRKNKRNFIRNRIVKDVAPLARSGEEILKQIEFLRLKRVTEVGAQKWNEKVSKNSGWKKRSLFWDLPYWKTNVIRHNIDVMHTEKNVFMNIFNTVMAIDGKTKDNVKARRDMTLLCNRKHLEFNNEEQKYPKAAYSLETDAKKAICEWVKDLRFPDGYVSNLGRCVDTKKHKLNGNMKSHDCHVFMQRLLPIAFRELVPNDVWEALAEISIYFRTLTSASLRLDDLEKLILQIPITLCKLEMIFPPGFFDSMEHLVLHLAEEARLAGPVQGRWMYPFEREMGHNKKHVRNKARVEASMCEGYTTQESSTFCSFYLEPHLETIHRKVPRNDAHMQEANHECNLSIFTQTGRAYGRAKKRTLDEQEYAAAHTYILLNCPEVDEYRDDFISYVRSFNCNISDEEVDRVCENNFASWFRECSADEFDNEFIKDLAKGPLNRVMSVPVYFVNGFKFHTMTYGANKSTDCSGVCIRGTNNSECVIDYYGRIVEILIVEYLRLPIKKVVLFKCDWFDPTPNVGTRIHLRFGLVDVHRHRRLRKYEPFILATQASQVAFVTYPSVEHVASVVGKGEYTDWLAVCNIKARPMVEIATPTEDSITVPPNAFQDKETNVNELFVDLTSESIAIPLHDSRQLFVDLPLGEDESEDEAETQTFREEDGHEDEYLF